MDMTNMLAHCAAYEGAQECFPFGPLPVCFKAGPKQRLFAQVYPDKVTLRCTRLMGEVWRSEHPAYLLRGYHCPPRQAPYFITALLDDTPDELLQEMLTHAYLCVMNGLK